MIFNFTYLVPPSTPQILVQQRVNSYQISLRGPPGDDTFGAPRLGDHYSNQPFVTNKDSSKNGWTGSNEGIKTSKNFILFHGEQHYCIGSWIHVYQLKNLFYVII